MSSGGVKTILCVDDEPATAAMFEHALANLGHEAILANNGEEALAIVASRHIDLILADSQAPRMSGLELLDALDEHGYRVPVVIVTAQSSIEHAVHSMRRGAVDYLTKPVRLQTLEITIQHALDFARLRRENETFRQEITRIQTRRRMVGHSAALHELQDVIVTVAPTRATVLVEGESGTGKELIARAIHDQSPRRDLPFITINCAALPEGLVESALFGHEKGAFTGAASRMQGAFERADGGTLLLDEISEMRLDLQSKLLRAIQEQEFERVGGRELIRVDVRIIATTNRRLRDEVDAGRFRADLYYRLHVFPLHVPPLRDRREDIPLLTRYFVQKHAHRMGRNIDAIPTAVLDALTNYDWPGNIRELQNVLERSVILTSGSALQVPMTELIGKTTPMRLEERSSAEPHNGERARILKALEEARGQVGGPDGAAARLGLKRTTLQSRMRKFNISREFR